MRHPHTQLVSLVASLMLTAATVVSAQRGGPPPPVPQQEQRAMGAAGISLFAESNFHGMNANFRSDVSDLRKFNMNDRVDSLQIGRGEIWEVCEDINYHGRCQVFSGDEQDLGRVGWGGIISSLRRVRDNGRGSGGFGGDRGREFPPPPPVRSRLILFDQLGFRGQSFAIIDASPVLHALNNRAGSAKVYGGAWELCDGPRFTGRCTVVSESQTDLGRVFLRDKVSSARPVSGRGR